MGTLLELREAVAGDIRDPNFATFTTGEVDDFINAGQADVNRAYPLQAFEVLQAVADDTEYATTLASVFRVDILRDDIYWRDLPQADGVAAQSGWEHHAGLFLVPRSIAVALEPTRDSYNLWGYRYRARLETDEQVTELDTDAEFAVRAYARWAAYQTMLADRTVFKQWQGVSQNTDISVNQLEQLVGIYSREWEQARNRLRMLRRQ